MPDFFHVVHELIKSYSLAIGRHLRQAHQDLKQAQEALARCQERPHAAHDAPEATLLVAARQTEVRRWDGAHHSDRGSLEPLLLEGDLGVWHGMPVGIERLGRQPD